VVRHDLEGRADRGDLNACLTCGVSPEQCGLEDLMADAGRRARTIPAAQVLSQIGSPFTPDQQPVLREELNHCGMNSQEAFSASGRLRRHR
jgi:hypothetical protein